MKKALGISENCLVNRSPTQRMLNENPLVTDLFTS